MKFRNRSSPGATNSGPMERRFLSGSGSIEDAEPLRVYTGRPSCSSPSTDVSEPRRTKEFRLSLSRGSSDSKDAADPLREKEPRRSFNIWLSPSMEVTDPLRRSSPGSQKWALNSAMDTWPSPSSSSSSKSSVMVFVLSSPMTFRRKIWNCCLSMKPSLVTLMASKASRHERNFIFICSLTSRTSRDSCPASLASLTHTSVGVASPSPSGSRACCSGTCGRSSGCGCRPSGLAAGASGGSSGLFSSNSLQ
mmetsp:Transcript_39331/g.125045  ORF Transcript_39331/g.125045 Transcript_39331/m.125045 type:complete len:250 (-) Transcript_39331:433-1182(-)